MFDLRTILCRKQLLFNVNQYPNRQRFAQSIIGGMVFNPKQLLAKTNFSLTYRM